MPEFIVYESLLKLPFPKIIGLPSKVLNFFSSTILGCPPLLVKIIFIKLFSSVSKCSALPASVLKPVGNCVLAFCIESVFAESINATLGSVFGLVAAIESSTRFFSVKNAWLLRLLIINMAINNAPINTNPITVFLSIPMSACF